MTSLSTAAGLASTFATALEDPRTVVLGDAVGRLGGFGGVFAGLRDAHPARVLDLPVADRGTLGLGVGMALGGHRVIVELAATSRLFAGLEALAEAASFAASGEFPVRLSVRVPAGGQAGERIDRPVAEALAAIEGLSVLCPSTSATALGAWKAALDARAPVVVLEPRTLLTRRSQGAAEVRLGASRSVRPGGDVTLVSWGSGTGIAVEAADALLSEDIQAGVLDLVSLSPLDRAGLGAAVRETGRVVVVDAPEGGLSDAVLRGALDEAFLYLEAPPVSVAPDVAAVTAAATEAALY